MFDQISEIINNILIEYLSVAFHICGGFSYSPQEWLFKSNKIVEESRYCIDFSVIYEITQIMEEPTCILDATGHNGEPP